MTRLLRCLHCSGTGWDSPPCPDRKMCRECAGEGELPETHPWSGYIASYDYTRGSLIPRGPQ
jgi:DnaJ-class molecular chaperone